MFPHTLVLSPNGGGEKNKIAGFNFRIPDYTASLPSRYRVFRFYVKTLPSLLQNMQALPAFPPPSGSPRHRLENLCYQLLPERGSASAFAEAGVFEYLRHGVEEILILLGAHFGGLFFLVE